jgi:hypothetical protein
VSSSSRLGEHLLVVRQRTGPVLQLEAHLGEAADGLLVGEIELVAAEYALRACLAVAERASTLPSLLWSVCCSPRSRLPAFFVSISSERLGLLPLSRDVLVA